MSLPTVTFFCQNVLVAATFEGLCHVFEVESDYDEEENNDKLESTGGTVPTIQPTTYSISPNICAIAIADYGTVCVEPI